MRFIKMRQSGVDQGIKVFEFILGKEELKLLAAILSKAKANIPRTFETMSMLGRIRNMTKVIGKTLEEYEK